MQLRTPHLSGGETTSRPNTDNVWPILIDYFRADLSRANCHYKQATILAARIFISLYLVLVYLKPLPELGLAHLLQIKKLSDVMAIDN